MSGEQILKRILNIIPMLFIISLISFMLISFSPGDPVQAYVTPSMNYEDIVRIKHNMGLDKPFIVRYFYWLKAIVGGDFGFSMITHNKVSVEIAARVVPTLILMGTSMVIAILIAIFLGVYVAMNKNKAIDKIVTLISYIGISIPSFWFAMILISIFSMKLKLLPSIGMHTIGIENSTFDVIRHMILPCIVLAFPNISMLIRYVRSSVINEMKQDYTQTAIAKGVSQKRLMYIHILKNSLLPLITILCMSLPDIFTGAFITETIFGWPGMGRLGITSFQSMDYPMIMAIIMMSSVLLILGNFVADILYLVVDPRIRVVGDLDE